jgi:hypothetical protein
MVSEVEPTSISAILIAPITIRPEGSHRNEVVSQTAGRTKRYLLAGNERFGVTSS